MIEAWDRRCEGGGAVKSIKRHTGQRGRDLAVRPLGNRQREEKAQN